ncbi:ETS-related transcription factor Elf-3 [Clarias gariepinus]|uniref:ETS-related transcription factor Elf-3 n=1 Tax=Clarias gariepinus TaxID=13013 RepID=UPI00234E2098|nr:ETS-related transcription factor Elf-3 [Clarias gariepinus]
MMASSELSHILNNANANLYPSETSLHPAGFPTMHRNTPFNDTHYCNSNNNVHSTVGPWQQLNPQFWSRRNVLDWIDFHVEDSKYDASLLNLECCNMDGSVLCSLSRDAMTAAFGPQLGETLHQNLENLKHKQAEDITQNFMLNETYELLNSFLLDLPQSPFSDGPTLDSVIVQSVATDNKESDLSYYNEYKTQLTPGSDHGYESYSESLQSSIPGGLMNPSSPESAGSDSEHEYAETQHNYSPKSFKQEPVEKKRRGRPPKLGRGSEHFIENKKNKHAPRGTHLWEFIRDILIHPERNQGLMKWEDRRDGVFKFLKSEAVAQLWGQKKKNTSMTYEKLSRAMRYYYKREILERVDGRRLVYKFGKNSSGWKLEELGV